jgi:hypothetical protein
MHLLTIYLKFMNQKFNNSKYKVINNLINNITPVLVINFLVVKIKLKVMIINLVAILWKKNFKIIIIIVSRLNKTLAYWMR